jgi:hypothetical protein
MEGGMATSTNGQDRKHRTTRAAAKQRALTLSPLALAVAAALAAGPAAAVGRIGSLDIVSRSDGQVLPVYNGGSRNWVVGTPGREYSIRYCNSTPGRVLAVMSVDGVNVVSGETASPAQSGYVLDAYECADIQGWRKDFSRTAAFYFTELPDAYATRTGRPENVGVIGVAVFRERPQRIAWRERLSKTPYEGDRRDAPAAPAERAAGSAVQDAQSSADAISPREESAGRLEAAPSATMPTPAPLSKLGTGHGRSEDSPAQRVRFERESATPSETIAIHYDRRENLVAMGILPSPIIARTPNPFPAWPRFVPDPPAR